MLTRRAFLLTLAKITAGSAGAVALSRLPIPEDPQHAAFLRGEGPRHFAGATLPGLRGYRLVPDPGTTALRARVDVDMRDYKIDMIDITSIEDHGMARRYMPVLREPEHLWTPAPATLLQQSDGAAPPNWTTVAHLTGSDGRQRT